MTGNELLKSMLCTTQTPDQTAAIACSKAGISPTADYYAGAVQTVQQACTRKKTNAYQISLCNHLHQLEQDTQPYDKQPEKKLLRDGIRTVQPYRRFYTPLQKLHRLQVRACSRCFCAWKPAPEKLHGNPFSEIVRSPCRYQIPRKTLVLNCWGMFEVQSQSISS